MFRDRSEHRLVGENPRSSSKVRLGKCALRLQGVLLFHKVRRTTTFGVVRRPN